MSVTDDGPGRRVLAALEARRPRPQRMELGETFSPQELGELTLSMLRGEQGYQARELDELIAWLKTQPKTDVICLSNALLIGMARKLKCCGIGLPSNF